MIVLYIDCMSPSAAARSYNVSHEIYTNTIIIFDWDDTLLASTKIIGQPTETRFLEAMESQVIKLLMAALEYACNVFIVTNAEIGWVELSCSRYMPRVLPYIRLLRVISARTEYEKTITESTKWKSHAFGDSLGSLYSANDALNVISFGDSECEREALLTIKRKFDKSKTKSIKFIEKPTIEQLVREQEMIYKNMNYLVNHSGSLDLMLTISSCRQINKTC